VRTLQNSTTKDTAIQYVEVSNDKAAAGKAYTSILSWLSACSTPQVRLASSYVTTGVGEPLGLADERALRGVAAVGGLGDRPGAGRAQRLGRGGVEQDLGVGQHGRGGRLVVGGTGLRTGRVVAAEGAQRGDTAAADQCHDRDPGGDRLVPLARLLPARFPGSGATAAAWCAVGTGQSSTS
jgi:hypothetical protein